MAKPREQWRLPKTFELDPEIDGFRQRHSMPAGDNQRKSYYLFKLCSDTTWRKIRNGAGL